jgi:glycerol transport system permease protein
VTRRARRTPASGRVATSTWLLVLPALAILGGVGLIPLITVLNYSFHDIFSIQNLHWIGLEWYGELVRSERFHGALMRSLLFTAIVLSVQMPLGLAVALLLRRCGRFATPGLMLVALPLVVPWNLIPPMWLNLIAPGTGMLGGAAEAVGFDHRFTALHTWILIVAMDTWHWLGLVTIMAYAGLSAIPSPVYQAAAIDGASRLAVLRHIELPRLAGALSIVLLLRTVDSLMIYTEAFGINAGGPNFATAFLTLDLGEQIKAFDYGPAAARSIVYFLIVAAIAWAFVKIRQNDRSEATA